MKCCLGLMLFLVGAALAYNKEYASKNLLKIRCYQCNQPYQCGHGVCYGDLCVKTSISQNNAYVSKGCENITHAVSHYEPQLKLKSYCRTEVVFGIESTICYCRDDDFCNDALTARPSVAVCLLVVLLLLKAL
ncbi:hypothetical protein Y032_0022g466 [Ancylostoma ceylanicum]|uniref:Activin types I and II receptor domain-containing protein n=2 Tax=Ancylostoma ceylanicum TaxID=53326 RepID=A0A016UYQ2_9BILA|nr:hypothetical protein Y032_0022g466 [Ancylostoma ceylanicum]